VVIPEQPQCSESGESDRKTPGEQGSLFDAEGPNFYGGHTDDAAQCHENSHQVHLNDRFASDVPCRERPVAMGLTRQTIQRTSAARKTPGIGVCSTVDREGPTRPGSGSTPA